MNGAFKEAPGTLLKLGGECSVCHEQARVRIQHAFPLSLERMRKETYRSFFFRGRRCSKFDRARTKHT